MPITNKKNKPIKSIVFLEIVFLIILIEATTNIITKAKITEPIRNYLFNHSSNRVIKFLHDLIECSYCASVWVSGFYCLMLWFYISSILPIWVIFIFIALVFHRLSNVLHFIIDRVDSNHISAKQLIEKE